jgi:CBS domain-containing protein
MQIKKWMKRNVFYIHIDTTIGEAARVFTEKHIGMLPVVDADGQLKGLLPLRSLLMLVMPDFVSLIEDFDFVYDFGAAEMRVPDAATLQRPVREIMLPPQSVEDSCGLLRATALLNQYQLHDLPVVDGDGKLVGIVSRVDVGTAFLSNWNITQAGTA